MAYRILLVEDDHQIREVIEDYFDSKGGEIAVVAAQDGGEGLSLIKNQEFDLVILDVMLPEIDGFSLCREIRRDSIVPVLFLTARAREEDILYGYELGCDDYIVKPFSPAALYAKVMAILKRAGGMVIEKELVCGKIRMNLVTLQVYADGSALTLAPKEFALLKLFMEHKNWVMSRDMLLDKIWGIDYFGSDRVVDNHIKKLRKALGSAGGQIKTVVTKGYKLTEEP
ncbi:MAG: response regulator transcription factor [Ruminiclostridium sp.]|nr:response regulator transcription factor [Ruminiclostridium sp.]